MDFSSEKFAKDKLIILYCIFKINIPLSEINLMKIILENNFMDYFTFQTVLEQLINSSFIQRREENGMEVYAITSSGENTLELLLQKIPSGIKARIDNMAKSIVKSIKDSTSVLADYYPEGNDDYLVNCKISEQDFMLLDLKLAVGSKNEAKIVCENFKKNSQTIYSEIVKTLFKN